MVCLEYPAFSRVLLAHYTLEWICTLLCRGQGSWWHAPRGNCLPASFIGDASMLCVKRIIVDKFCTFITTKYYTSGLANKQTHFHRTRIDNEHTSPHTHIFSLARAHPLYRTRTRTRAHKQTNKRHTHTHTYTHAHTHAHTHNRGKSHVQYSRSMI